MARIARRPIVLATASAAAVMLLAGCAAAEPEPTAAPALEPSAGGEIVYAVDRDPACIDPAQTSAHPGVTIGRQLTDSLLDQDLETGEIVPWLAESYEVNADATEYTFVLRDDVTFSNGEKLTAEVVAGNLDWLATATEANAVAKAPFASYTGTEAISDTEFVVSFSAPNAPFLQAASDVRLGIVAPETLALDAAGRCAGVIGTGPFVLESYEPEVVTSIVKRDDYAWASSVADHNGPAYLDRIEFQVATDNAVRAGLLTSGQVDGAADIAIPYEEQVSDLEYTLMPMANPGLSNSIYFNMRNPEFADVEVREALALATNRQEIVDTVLSPRREAAGSPLSNSTQGYVDLSTEFDLKGAIELLESAGWTEGSDGIRERDGERLAPTVIFIAGNPDLGLQLLQQQWAAAGIELTLRPLSLADWNTALREGTDDLMWMNSTRADADVLYRFHTGQATNFSLIEDAELDELLEAQRAASDPAERAEIVGEAQRVIVENFYAITLDHQYQMHGIAPQLHGVEYEPSARLKFYDAWVEPTS